MQAERSAHSPVAYNLRFVGQVFDGQAGLLTTSARRVTKSF
jgi:hypothetical protein